MTVNADLVGRSYPPSPVYEVGREKLREFATAIGDMSPALHSPEAAAGLGHADVVAAPTFMFAPAFAAMAVAVTDPDLAFDFARVVHGDQRFVHVRPLCAGDRISCVVTIESLRSMAGNNVLTLRADVSTETGETVGSMWSTLVSRKPE